MAIDVASTPTLRRVLGFRTVLSTSAGLAYAAFALTTLYVYTAVPRMQAKLAAQRATVRRRRPGADGS